MSHDPKTTLSTPAKKIIYMALYDAGNDVLRKHNPCEIKDGECAAGKGHLARCCGGCEHLTPTGCGVSALTCKLHLCGRVVSIGGENVQEANAGLYALFQVAKKVGLMYGPYDRMRQSFEQRFPK